MLNNFYYSTTANLKATRSQNQCRRPKAPSSKQPSKMTTPLRRSLRIAIRSKMESLTKAEKDLFNERIKYHATLEDCFYLLEAFRSDVIDVLGGLPRHEDDDCECQLSPEELAETIASLRRGMRLLTFFFRKLALRGMSPQVKGLLEDKICSDFTKFYHICLDLQGSLRTMRTGEEYEPLSGNLWSKAEYLYTHVYNMYKRVQIAYEVGI